MTLTAMPAGFHTGLPKAHVNGRKLRARQEPTLAIRTCRLILSALCSRHSAANTDECAGQMERWVVLRGLALHTRGA